MEDDETLKCFRCGKDYSKIDNKEDSCVRHDGYFYKAYGSYGDYIDFWTCCNKNKIIDKGCIVDYHENKEEKSYDPKI